MPLEDVDHMIDNSVKESTIMCIDSSTRDKHAYKTPSEYTVYFTNPIRNVFGLEIMDVSIPATMFNIDIYNNIFGYAQVFLENTYNANDFVRFFAEIQYNKEFDYLWSGLNNAEIFICIDKTSYDTLKGSILNQVTYSQYCMFYRNVVTNDKHSIRNVSSLDRVIDGIEYMFQFDNKYYAIRLDDPLYDLIISEHFAIIDDRTLVYYDHFYFTQNDIDYVIDRTLPRLYDLWISTTVITIEIGNYDIITLYQYFNSALEGIAQNRHSSVVTTVSLTPSQPNESGTVMKQCRFSWNFDESHPFILDMKKSTCRNALGFSQYAIASNIQTSDYIWFSSYATEKSTGYYKLRHKSNEQLFMSLLKPGFENDEGIFIPLVNNLISPGMVDLTGERYIRLRIPEIEQHMNLSFAYSAHFAGTALIKLASSTEMTHLRFDFVNLIKKPFHPIGKLGKLTMRFETKNGDLYDFKGIDHHFVVMINFYAPRSMNKLQNGSILNPNYMPNVHDYIYKDVYHEDEENDYDNYDNIVKQINYEQKMYAYSSDEDSD